MGFPRLVFFLLPKWSAGVFVPWIYINPSGRPSSTDNNAEEQWRWRHLSLQSLTKRSVSTQQDATPQVQRNPNEINLSQPLAGTRPTRRAIGPGKDFLPFQKRRSWPPCRSSYRQQPNMGTSLPYKTPHLAETKKNCRRRRKKRKPVGNRRADGLLRLNGFSPSNLLRGGIAIHILHRRREKKEDGLISGRQQKARCKQFFRTNRQTHAPRRQPPLSASIDIYYDPLYPPSLTFYKLWAQLLE